MATLTITTHGTATVEVPTAADPAAALDTLLEKLGVWGEDEYKALYMGRTENGVRIEIAIPFGAVGTVLTDEPVPAYVDPMLTPGFILAWPAWPEGFTTDHPELAQG